ncbi:MAG: hypothetical protein GYB64_16065 [Chloroflexi bacterium]|nr:hypothetical protein [Chloroflexota bacterium]
MPPDVPPMSEQFIAMLEADDRPKANIIDFREVNLNFSDIVAALGMVAKGEAAPFHHPNLVMVAAVTESALVEMSANALRQVQYGTLRTGSYRTVEAATAEIMQYISKT